MRFLSVIVTLGLFAPLSAWANTAPVPEPGILPLLALGGVIGLAIAMKGRRK